MIVGPDTNVVLQMFGSTGRHRPLLVALLQGRLVWALSNAILLEYEETVVALSTQSRWEKLLATIHAVSARFGTVHFIAPHFGYRLIHADPDDDKFVDCALAAGADYLITNDGHFEPLRSAGYKTQPITPEEFIERFLA
ncbi:MAG TPA: putative toxin-antitoxin system toxin component, PIN family [Chthoniobacteraceae bacterium]|jgi:putative PIN family toxin of toxin-antitoxin system|nr:putative toxin-antitoxin system toxin component, PIN family [Chthoniobacteraceae bacterium]